MCFWIHLYMQKIDMEKDNSTGRLFVRLAWKMLQKKLRVVGVPVTPPIGGQQILGMKRLPESIVHGFNKK